MEEFHQIFFEEADELIEAMEAELLEMVFEPDNPDRINNVFRAAHSIKGGAATFGFAEITDTTHVMETLMNEVREGSLAVTRPLIDVLLSAADCFRDMLAAARRGEPANADQAARTRASLQEWLSGGNGAEQTAAVSGPAAAADSDPALLGTGLRRYRIGVRPAHEMFRRGNDPLHIFRALRELGDLEVVVDPDSVPGLADFEADKLYLAWTLHLATKAGPDQVLETFEWVDDVCEVEFEEILPAPDAAAAVEPAAVEPDAAVEAAARKPVPDSPHPASAPGRSDGRGPGEAATIRVGIDKIDALINLVGELVITQSMLGDLGDDLECCDPERLRDGLLQLKRHTRELQEHVLRIRMVPMSNVFNRLPRTVHDLTARLGKKLDLVLHGEHTELDKTLMERLGDPLIHLVRNAVDHGIETPTERIAAGKPEQGRLTLRAYHANGDVVIEVGDDGAGLDSERILAKARARGLVGPDDALTEQQIHELVFQPGFSTAEAVSDVSGRGVGMDVVRQNMLELGGTVEIASARGRGTTFTIRLPLTLAIVDGQLLRLLDQTYVVPLVSVIESVQVRPSQLNAIAGRGLVYRLRDEFVPAVDLAGLFGMPRRNHAPARLLVLVDTGQGRLGLLVDDLLAQQQVVVKTLEANYRAVPGVSGATVLGDGRVALILDMAGIARLLRARSGHGALLPGIRAA